MNAFAYCLLFAHEGGKKKKYEKPKEKLNMNKVVDFIIVNTTVENGKMSVFVLTLSNAAKCFCAFIFLGNTT
jgi:hypothetical protein